MALSLFELRALKLSTGLFIWFFIKAVQCVRLDLFQRYRFSSLGADPVPPDPFGPGPAIACGTAPGLCCCWAAALCWASARAARYVRFLCTKR